MQRDFETIWKPTPLGHIRNLAIEFLILIKIIVFLKVKKKIVVFPCGTKSNNAASLLRAYNIASGLRKYFSWSAIIVPPSLTLSQRQRIIKLVKPDILFIQMERHPLNRPMLYDHKCIVFDIDDSDYLWPDVAHIVIECCRHATHVIAGSNVIANWIREYNQAVTVIWTSADSKGAGINFPPHFRRKKIIAWGHSRPQDYIPEADFIQAILLEVSKYHHIEYWVFGVNTPEVLHQVSSRLSKKGVKVKSFPSMGFSAFVQRLKFCSIGLQVLSPASDYSQGKSFGKILSYILAGVAVIASNTGEHPYFFHENNGRLASSKDDWVEEILNLLNDSNLRDRLSVNAFHDFDKQLSTKAISCEYDKLFRKLMNG